MRLLSWHVWTGLALVGMLVAVLIRLGMADASPTAYPAISPSFASVLIWKETGITRQKVSISTVPLPCQPIAIHRIVWWQSVNATANGSDEKYVGLWGITAEQPSTNSGNPMDTMSLSSVLLLDELQGRALWNSGLVDGVYFRQDYPFDPPLWYNQPTLYSFFAHQWSPLATTIAGGRWWLYYECLP